MSSAPPPNNTTASDLRAVELIPNPAVQRSGLQAYGYLLNKYGFNPTKPGPFSTVSEPSKAASVPTANFLVGSKSKHRKKLQYKGKNGQLGKVPASVVRNDFEWLCPVKVGTPAKTYNLVFDTGSADTWLWSTQLPATVNTSGRHIFDPSKSRTFEPSSDKTWKISYNDDSSASGTVGTDILNLGGLKVNNQSIELADFLSPSFQNVPGDGLLGLAYGFINHVSPLPVATPPENLIIQKKVPTQMQLFTAYLSSYRDAKDRDNKSFYTFGFIDKTALGGQEIHYADVDNSQGLWQFPSTTVSVGDRQVVRFDNTAVADTASSLALIDDSVAGAIYSAIPGGVFNQTIQGWTFPTSTTIDQLPLVKFAVGDQEFPIQKEDLAYADLGNGFTYGGIQSRGDLSFDVFGDTFLKSVYSIFDIGSSRFGVVTRSDSTQIPASAKQPVVPRTPRLQSVVSSPYLVKRSNSSSPSSSPPSSQHTPISLGTRTHSAVDGLGLVYGLLILFSALGPGRGSVRLFMAGVVCACLLV